MKINDFDIKINKLSGVVFECLLKNKTFGITFYMKGQGLNTPPKEWVFEQFINRPKDFFIDLPCVFSADWLITYDI